MQLYERMRPKCFAEVIGQRAVLATLAHILRGGAGGRAFWLSGKSGTGKTTIARLIALTLADEFNWTDVDAGSLTGAAIRELERASRSTRIGRLHGTAVFVNEAHALREDAILQLLVTLERIPAHVCWLFTT